MGRVFIVQCPMKKVGGRWVKKFDVETPARHFGEPRFLLPPGSLPDDLSGSGTTERLKADLVDFSDSDFIVAVGDPVAIALVALIAAQANDGRVTILRWCRIDSVYRLTHIRL